MLQSESICAGWSDTVCYTDAISSLSGVDVDLGTQWMKERERERRERERERERKWGSGGRDGWGQGQVWMV